MERPGQQRGHALRLGRYSQTGQFYLVTAVTKNREPIFADFHAARCLIQVLRHTHQHDRADSLAFVVMPDHLHWLFALGPGLTLSELMREVKAVSAHRLRQPFWQKGFHDHALRSEESVVNAARYLIRNPLRAGLVQRVGDYPHWDAVWLP